MNLTQLAGTIAVLFDINELRDLTSRLEIAYDDLAGQTREDKARELVQFCQRHGRLDDLLTLCAELRPNQPWALDQPPPEWQPDKPIVPWARFAKVGLIAAVFAIGALVLFAVTPNEPATPAATVTPTPAPTGTAAPAAGTDTPAPAPSPSDLTANNNASAPTAPAVNLSAAIPLRKFMPSSR